jgi:ornithine cyclodeaminase/alanine dehydrogenase-like protein (mu-crystallin family)
MITITEDEVRQRLDPAHVITAIEAAFRDRYASMVIPDRTHLPTTQGVFLIMLCHDRGANAMGMKLVVVQDKPALPEDRIQATYLLFDPDIARPRLVASANYLTDLRTAATSAMATKFLAHEDVRTLGVFGTGRQARAHIQVLPLVRRFARVLIRGNDPAQSREFATKMSEEVRLPVESVDAQTCASQSDVLCTCTTSQVPLFDGNVLRPGTHLNLIGAFQPQAREVDSRTVQRARVFVDTYDAALAEAGDLLVPIKEGVIRRDHIACDLHELLTGKKPGRTSPEQITLFKSVGCALEDLATAELLEH